MLTREEILERLRELSAKLLMVEVDGYKVPGQHETYGPYREGRADLADEVSTALDALLRDADAPGDAPTTGDTEP